MGLYVAEGEDPKTGDRSGHCYNVTCLLLEAKFTQAEIYIAGKDAPFMSKYARRKNGVEGQIASIAAKWEKAQKKQVETKENWDRMIEKAVKAGKVAQLPTATRAALKPASQERHEEAEDLAAEDVAEDELAALDAADAKKADQAEKRRAKKAAEAEARKKANEEALNEAEAEAEAAGLPKLPRPFRHTPDFSVEYLVPGTEKDPGGWARLCTSIKFVGAYRDPENGSWGHLVEVKDSDGIWHRVTISHAQAAKDNREVLALLHDRGLIVFGGGNGKFRFLDLIAQHLAKVTERVRCVSQTGWHTARDGKEYFVLPNQVYGPIEGEEIICQPKGSQGAAYGVNGTLEGWRKDIARLAVGNSRLALAIAAGFAAPLLKLMGMEGGGFNFRGPSSIGKTTILRAAASLCGGPDYVKSWRTTDNALEGTAAAHCDMLLPMDELAQIEPRAAAQSAYMLTNGEGKGRMSSDATMKRSIKWRTVFLSTGEISLADKIEEGGGKAMAGQAARVIDISADAGRGCGIFEGLHGFKSGAQLSDAIRAGSATHFGIAADAYLNRLTDDLDGARQRVRDRMDAFEDSMCPINADGQVKRALGRFALVAAAGELATEWGITGWSKGEATRAAEKCFEAWLEGRGGMGPQEMTNALSRVRSYIELHGASRFQEWTSGLAKVDGPDGHVTSKSPSGGAVINQLGYVKTEEQEKTYYFFPEVFKTEVCKRLDVHVVCKALRDIGALDKDGSKNQKSCRIPKLGKRRMYVIRGDKLFACDDEKQPEIGTA